MNKPIFQRWVGFLAVAWLLFWASGCEKREGQKAGGNISHYTCTMHPSVKSQDPKAKCPICGMDLVPVMKKGANGAPTPEGTKSKGADGMATMEPMGGKDQLNEFNVPVERQQQIGVTYAEVKRQSIQHTIRSVGYIVPDKARHWEFVARVEGYVHKLHVTSPGELVKKDEPLLTVYSPELLTTERELVNLLANRDRATVPAARESMQRMVDSAKFRLAQWNVPEERIADLERNRKPSEFLTFTSPFNGIVEQVPVDQGQRVMSGEHLVDVADLSVVWVWAEFYENELPMLKRGQKVTITSRSYPNEPFHGEVALIDPFLDPVKRTGKVRIDIPNPDLHLRPAMYANIELTMDMGEALTIPVSAIMPTGTRNLVFIDKGEGRLEPRFVQLGQKYGEIYEVAEGVKEGERVVSSANFLIDAESKVQGAVKLFEPPTPETAKPPEKSATKAAAKAETIPLPEAARSAFEALFEPYLAIHKLLAQDKYDGVPEHAAKVRQQAEILLRAEIQPPKEADVYRERLEAVQKSASKFQPTNLESARVQFGQLSWDLVALVTQFPPPLERPLHSMHCPMWKKSPGCWLQEGKEIENPFMGQAMLTCGKEIKSLEEAQ